MSLIFKLASRNLFQDKLRFIATIIGIVFSIVLVSVQLGLFLGFQRMVTTMIDHTPADLWIVSLGTKCFEDPSLLDKSDATKALAVPGVTAAVPLLIGFTEWSVPNNGSTPVFVVGTSPNGLYPWHIVQGDLNNLSDARGVAVDQSYFGRLGVNAVGETTTIRDHKVEVKAITKGIRSFTTTPYIFAPLDSAQDYVGVPHNDISYLLVRLAPGTNVAAVRRALMKKLDKVEVLTQAEFRDRSRTFWLFGTGAGAALFGGALLGAIVGTIIIAQTLYSSTKDHLTEFATLRAIGSSSLYIHKVIVSQALLSAVIGFGIAGLIDYTIVRMTTDSALPIVMTPLLMIGLFALTVVMCVSSSASAIVQVMRIDPARVFRQ
jgi:putative ABC transport system permease protein